MRKICLLIFGLIAVGYTARVTFLTHEKALVLIQQSDIGIASSGGCSDRNIPTCTSLERVRLNTISGIRNLKSVSGCQITITGGTEVGHASGTHSHWNGFKLDIRLYDCINDYIRNTYTFVGNRPGDNAPLYEDVPGNIYALESNHWDILYF